MRIIKKIIAVLLAIVIIVIAGYCFYYGYILNNESKPKNVFSKVIYKIDENIIEYFKLDEQYKLKNDFSITGDIDYNIEGAYYLESSKVNPDDIKIYNRINNLNNSKITFTYIQNEKEDKLYSEYNHLIGEEQVLLRKTYIDSATEYEFINTVSNKYINNGNSKFFETISASNTINDNIKYIHEFILGSLINNLKEEYFEKEKIKVYLNEEEKETYQMSLRIDNKRYKEILNNIIKDIRKDNKANNIICGLYNDFPNYKIDSNKRFLEKDETYTINVYTDNIWYKPLKYEVVHLKEDSRDTYSYVGDLNGELSYVHNDELKYNAKVSINHKMYLLEFNNKSGKNIGKIKLDKNVDMYNLDVDLILDKKSYVLSTSTKIKDYEENKGYTINNLINVRYSEDDKIRFSGSLNNKINISNESTIKEEAGDVIIRTALTEEEENNYKNYIDNLKLRLER